MRTVAAGVVLLLVAVSGCSSDEAAPVELGPAASGSVSPSARTSPSTSPSLLEGDETSNLAEVPAEQQLPSAATTVDAAGASSFARHYIATLQQALATGDVLALKALSDPACGGCNNLLGAIGEAHAAGRRVQGAELVVAFVEAPAVRAGETVVDLRYQRRAGQVVDADGNVVESIVQEGPIDTQMRVRHIGTAWSVLGFRQVPG